MFPAEVQAPIIPDEIEYKPGLMLIQKNSLVASGIPSFSPKFGSTAVLTALDEYWLIWEKYPELFRIITCESNWQNICNRKYGCPAGMGLGQLIPSTLKYCEKKLQRSLNPFNEKDNLQCSLWLYLNEGTIHWEKWSGNCWKK